MRRQERSFARRIEASAGVAAFLSLTLAGCNSLLPPLGYLLPNPDPLPTIDGPEESALQADIRAVVAVVQYPERNDIINVLDLTTGECLRSLEVGDTVRNHAGPDRDGRIIYSVSTGFNEPLELHCWEPGRGTTLLMARLHVDVLSIQPFQQLGLSPIGGRLVFAAQSVRPALEGEREFGRQQLEVWQLDPWRCLLVLDDAAQPAWFPDGRRLGFVRYMKPEEVPRGLANDGLPPDPTRKGDTPVIFSFDVESGEERALCKGRRPHVSPFGDEMLYRVARGWWRWLDGKSGEDRALELPGCHWGPIGFVAPSLVLYHAFPTTGTK